MANRNYNRKQALEKEVKEIYANVSITATIPEQLAPQLGADLEDFALLAASTITNTGFSVITGDLGLSPGTSVTGFPPGTVSGTQHVADAAAANAQIALTAIYTSLQALPPDMDLTGQDLGDFTLGPGVYNYVSSAQLTGTLTLDAMGDPAAVWVFQIASTLTTASASNVAIINGGSAGNVFFVVGSSATLGTTTDFKGNILCQASATLTTNANVEGSVLVRTGAITLDDNNVSVAPSVSVAEVIGTLTDNSVAGIQSVVRNGPGDFTATLEDAYFSLKSFKAALMSTTASDLQVQLHSQSVNNSSSKQVRFLILTGAVPTDPLVDVTLLARFELKNSGV